MAEQRNDRGRLKSDPSLFRIRVARTEDACELGELFRTSYSTLLKQSYGAAELDAALPALSKPNPVLLASGTFYLAHSQDGQLMGAGGWSVERPGTGDVVPHLAHIRHFATHPDWTRLGVGRAIYSHCERAAFSAGALAFECFSALNAVSFYEALGFMTASIITLSLGPGAAIPVALMKRSL